MEMSVLIQCGKCGSIGSEMEFSPGGNPREDLTCPWCGDTESLFDVEELEEGD